MDFELLNFWIEDYNFSILENDKKVKLYLRLKSCSKDILRSSLFLLCSDKNKILDFFGYDNSIEYDYLKSYNQYEYLCSSTKLLPRYIKYRGFKGPIAKDLNHKNFNKYLMTKYKSSSYINDDYSLLSDHKRRWLDKAIQFFEKEKEYQEYLDNRLVLDQVLKIKDELKINFNDFKRFICFHGITNIKNWDNDKFKKEFDKFISDGWNINLSMFSNKSY